MAFRLSNVNIQRSSFRSGANKVYAGWSKETERDFQQRLRKMDSFVKADTKVVVRNGAKDMVRDLVRITPIGTGRTRGFAKAGWGNSMMSLNMQPRAWYFRASGPRGERWRDHGGHRDELNKRFNPTYTLINEVPYVQEMRGGSTVVPRAYRSAARKYDKRLAKMGKRMAKKWKR